MGNDTEVPEASHEPHSLEGRQGDGVLWLPSLGLGEPSAYVLWLHADRLACVTGNPNSFAWRQETCQEIGDSESKEMLVSTAGLCAVLEENTAMN